MKGWVGLVGWPIADGLPTLVVTHQLQVECRTGKVRRPETDVLPLCHATNLKSTGIKHVKVLLYGVYLGSSVYRWYTQLDCRRFVYDTYKTMKVTRTCHGWVHMFITHRPTLTLQLLNFDLFRTCRTSSFCTVAWQLARFQLTQRIARSLGDSGASCWQMPPPIFEAHRRVEHRRQFVTGTEACHCLLGHLALSCYLAQLWHCYVTTESKIWSAATCSVALQMIFWLCTILLYIMCTLMP